MITTVKGRFIGGGLFEMKENKKKHSACVVLDGDDDQKKIRKIRDEALTEKFGSKIPKNLQDWTMKEGDDEDYASYGGIFINPKSSKKVAIGTKKNGSFEPVDQDDGVVYPGCHVHVSVSAYAYDSNPKENILPGVTLILRAVCFWKDGEPLGNRFSESEFDSCESEVDADAFGEAETTSSLL